MTDFTFVPVDLEPGERLCAYVALTVLNGEPYVQRKFLPNSPLSGEDAADMLRVAADLLEIDGLPETTEDIWVVERRDQTPDIQTIIDAADDLP